MSAPEDKRPRLTEAPDTGKVEITLVEQMADLLRRKPKNYDVFFSVGPKKIKVAAVKFVLKAASPVFEKEFDEKWENLVLKKDEGIPLPDIDPTAFKMFVNLIILDAWSLDSINALKLASNDLLSLLWLCRRFEITKAIKNLKQALEDFIKSFDAYTHECLEISRENLETIFSFEKIPLDENEIFEFACRWANNQCTIKELEPTGENYRKVLGGCVFEIRFPTMSNEEFTKINLLQRGLLKNEEKVTIYEYIGMTAEDRTKYDQTRLQFKTKRRVCSAFFGYSVLQLPQQYKLITYPPFVCDGSRSFVTFQVNEKISLHKIGFLGPFNEDTYFDVTVQISGAGKEGSGRCQSRKITKNIFARKEKIFYFTLDEPFIVESCGSDMWKNYHYTITFWLKGPKKNLPQYKVDNPKDESIQASGVTFYLDRLWNHGSPLAELRFKKI